MTKPKNLEGTARMDDLMTRPTRPKTPLQTFDWTGECEHIVLVWDHNRWCWLVATKAECTHCGSGRMFR